MGTGKNNEILSTNFQPFFWKKVKNIIRQNKKAALQEFLFRSQKINSNNDVNTKKKFKALENKVNSLAKQVTRLQERVIDLENYINNSKDTVSDLLKSLKTTKSIQQDDSKTNDKTPLEDQQCNLSSGQNQASFRTLSEISEDEKTEIIQTEFCLNQEGKISLKKYYESAEKYSLFKLRGYSIKYEST